MSVEMTTGIDQVYADCINDLEEKITNTPVPQALEAKKAYELMLCFSYQASAQSGGGGGCHYEVLQSHGKTVVVLEEGKISSETLDSLVQTVKEIVLDVFSDLEKKGHKDLDNLAIHLLFQSNGNSSNYKWVQYNLHDHLEYGDIQTGG